MFILLGTYIKEFASGGSVSAVLYIHYCTITSKKQAKANNKRETINHDGRPVAASGHTDLHKSSSDGVDPGLLRNPCFVLSSSARMAGRRTGSPQKKRRYNIMLADAAAMMLHKIIDMDNTIVDINKN